MCAHCSGICQCRYINLLEQFAHGFTGVERIECGGAQRGAPGGIREIRDPAQNPLEALSTAALGFLHNRFNKKPAHCWCGIRSLDDHTTGHPIVTTITDLSSQLSESSDRRKYDEEIRKFVNK